MKTIVFFFVMAGVSILSAQLSGSSSLSAIADPMLFEQQKSAGSILGTVIDINDRNPIENAVVEALGTGLKVTTGKDGQFKIANVAEGFYQVRSSAPGYEVQTQNNLYVEGSKPVTAFFMLKKIGSQLNSVTESTMPVPIATKSPSYPYEAKKYQVEGIFYFIVDISETGAINSAKCVEKSVYADNGKLKDGQVYDKYPQAVNQLEKEALESIWQWKFKPAMREGKPIEARVTLPVKFKLSDDKDIKKQ